MSVTHTHTLIVYIYSTYYVHTYTSIHTYTLYIIHTRIDSYHISYIVNAINLINVVKLLEIDTEVMMLEKAFAKLCGSYAATEAGITDPWLSN